MREERINDLKERLWRAEDRLDRNARYQAEERGKECVKITELKEEVRQMREERVRDLMERLKRAEDGLHREKECVIQ
ncbi:uncharacterized protein V6R79_005248 [Siganus canaliculatus]